MDQSRWLRSLLGFLAVSLLIPMLLFGQGSATISGFVGDEQGLPLPGTNVFIKDYDLGAATDVNGDFKFEVPARFIGGQEVKISARFMGYHSKTQTITLSSTEINVDFTLKQDVLNMEAVVVTGVAEETPKTMLPFTVARVSEEDLEAVPATSATEGLRGKVAGVKIIKGSGTPGEGIAVRLRGATSIEGSSAPLYIVDGVILGSDQVDIDANDIESVEVVKGAAGASMYGSRAANGVIQIKTRRGDNLGIGETRIRIRNEFGFNQFVEKEYRTESHHYKMVDGKYVDDDGAPIAWGLGMALDANAKGVAFQDNPFTGKTYDHMNLFFNPGYFYTNTASISQHRPGTSYMLSFSNLKESGIVDALDGYSRQNVRLNLDQKMTEDLNVSLSAYYATSFADDADRQDDPSSPTINSFYSLMFMSPNTNLLAKNDDGTPYKIQPDPTSLEENPLYPVNTQQLENKRNRLLGSLRIDYMPVKWFNLEGNLSYDRSNRLGSDYFPNGFKSVDNQNSPTGHYEKRIAMEDAMNSSATASFYKSFGDLSTKTKIRSSYESSNYDYTMAQGENLLANGLRSLGAAQDNIIIESNIEEIRSIGHYVITALDYQEKYITDLMFRYDGSSLFGVDQRWHPYYRGSLAWRLSKEDWWFSDALNEFKLRASYGTAGNRPRFSAQYETYDIFAGNIAKTRLGNKELKPSLSKELEIGLEMALLDRYSLEVAYARTITSDQILDVPLVAYYGYQTQWQNNGTLDNKTIEASIQAFIINKPDMRWSAGLVFDRTIQEITEFNRPPYTFGIFQVEPFYYREGEKMGAMYGKKFIEDASDLPEGYTAANFKTNNDGYLVPVGSGNGWQDGISKDLWGTKVDAGDGTELDWGMPVVYVDPVTGDDVVKIGDVIPDFSLGFTSNFKWKGLSVYAVMDAQIGGDIYNMTKQWAYRELRHVDVDQSGVSDANKKSIDYYNQLYNTNNINSHFVESGTYLKLRELSIQYSFDRAALKRLFGESVGNVFHGISIGVIGRNLLTFTNYSGFDPEVGVDARFSEVDPTILRLDNFGYPQYRTFTGVLEIEL